MARGGSPPRECLVETTGLLTQPPRLGAIHGGDDAAPCAERAGWHSGLRQDAPKLLLFLVIGVTILYHGPPERRRRRPNILVLFPDQLRHDWINSDTSSDFLVTPHLDRLRHHGVTFKRAIAASPLCAPSRACFATASNYDRAGVRTNRENLPNNSTTYYKLLQDAGYHTMAVGKLDLNKHDNLLDFGWGRLGNEHAAEWGFTSMVNCAGPIEAAAEAIDRATGSFHEPYMEFLRQHQQATAFQHDMRARDGNVAQYTMTDPTAMSDQYYLDNWITDQALALLEAAPHDREWFLIVNWNGPHPPMDITQAMLHSVHQHRYPQPVDPDAGLTPDQHNQIRRNYAAKIQNVDANIGRLLDALDVADTLVVFASDHGEMLGDRGLWGKQSPFQAAIGVPVVIAEAANFPILTDALRGTISTAPVSLIDVARTFIDVGGVRDVPASMADATSLRTILNGSCVGAGRAVQSGLASWRLLFDGQYKVIAGFGKDMLVFDLDADPYERHNLAMTPGVLPQRVQHMMQQLREEEVMAQHDVPH
ncbi:hypothetical protein H310_04238 [Aphanomyces invadans]|nr:hypothetical protein H310_04238 [Aphanomyces invadans]ETW05280.1 hypothetical protein H310_04238 [Aphanomyces invadans]|eukprot:XP_008866718.1 hypothetical protein H310_04238 [Aphanomyces invadans]